MTEMLSIQSMVEVARARNVIRKVAQEHHWDPLFRARMSATVTTLAEMALFQRHNNVDSMVIYFDIVVMDDQEGVVFFCDVNTAGCDQIHYSLAHSQLNRSCDEVKIDKKEDIHHIMVRLWAR